jgi:hypothetical protein
MMLTTILPYMFNIKLMVAKTVKRDVGLIHQFIILVFFYAYENAFFIEWWLESGKREVYFSDSLYLEFFLHFIGLLAVFFFLKQNNIKDMVGIFLNTFIPCHVWTLIIFFIYTFVTIPIAFYCDQNLIGDPTAYFHLWIFHGRSTSLRSSNILDQ